MKRHIKSSWVIIKESYIDFSNNKALKMSAALAFYTMFSLAPMLIVIISLCEIFLEKVAIEGSIFSHIQTFIGKDAALQIEQIIRYGTSVKDFTWTSAIGIGALLFAATGVFAEIQDSINQIWRLKAKPKKGWLKLILNRLLSFSMVVSLGFILLVSLVFNSVLDLFGQQLLIYLPMTEVYVAYSINLLITFITISFLFGIIFKVLPDAKIKWRDVIVGAIATAFLFMIGKFAIGYYLGRRHISSTYGAAGSMIIILLWVYYSSTILYFGAAFTRVFARYKGSDIYPNDYAVWIKEIELENKDSIRDEKNKIVPPVVISPAEK